MSRRPPVLPASSEADADRRDPAAELGSVVRELGRGYAELVESYRAAWGITTAEADAKAHEAGDWTVEKVGTDPPDQIAWWALAQAIERDPAAGHAAWERIKAEARKELRSGHRTAQALEWGGKPWDRARYLAICGAFAEGWRPRGGIEAALIEVLAQSFSAYLLWTERVTTLAETEGQDEDARLKKEGHWHAPRQATAEWMAWCGDQAERSYKRFLTTLKVMQDLRRSPGVFVASAGQVNLGAQQLNVAAPARPAERRRRAPRRDLPKPSG